MLIKKY